jgi:hypothetical protein
MKVLIHKIVSIVMASLVLFSTMSFTVDMHHCGDTLVDFSLFHNAKSCGMENEQSASSCESELTDNNCCTDSQIVLEGQDDLKLSVKTLTFEQQAFVVTFFYTYLNLFDDLVTSIVSYRDYRAPFLQRDIQKLHETYLI